MLEIASNEQLRLRARDVVALLDALGAERKLGNPWIVASVALPQGRKQPGAVQSIVARRPDETVLRRPPVQARQAAGFAGEADTGKCLLELRFGARQQLRPH